MNTRISAGLLVAALAVALPAVADHPHGGGEGRAGAEVHAGFVPHGASVGRVPRGAVEVSHASGHYWYHGGNWYAPRGPRWIVVAPPFGIYVPFLPGFYTTLWFGGVPYYYANDVYYVWRGEQNAYEVVEPPAGVAGAGSAAATPAPVDLYIYPRNGQSESQQSEDRFQCHHWATEQTHFDPTRQGGGGTVDPSVGRAEYFRAMGACLEGRGYTVK